MDETTMESYGIKSIPGPWYWAREYTNGYFLYWGSAPGGRYLQHAQHPGEFVLEPRDADGLTEAMRQWAAVVSATELPEGWAIAEVRPLADGQEVVVAAPDGRRHTIEIRQERILALAERVRSGWDNEAAHLSPPKQAAWLVQRAVRLNIYWAAPDGQAEKRAIARAWDEANIESEPFGAGW